MVHLYRVPLEQDPERYRASLSADEVARGARFHFERDRRAFTVAHGALRRVLAAYVGGAPEALVLSEGEHKKPILAGAPVRFNLSHAHGLGLLAVSVHEVGVDVERVEAMVDRDLVARRNFSPLEVAALEAAAERERERLFFTIWTRKEAFVKALGAGLHFPLRDFDVLGPESWAPRLDLRAGASSGGPWALSDVEVDDGYAAALVAALEAPPRVLRFEAA